MQCCAQILRHIHLLFSVCYNCEKSPIFIIILNVICVKMSLLALWMGFWLFSLCFTAAFHSLHFLFGEFECFFTCPVQELCDSQLQYNFIKWRMLPLINSLCAVSMCGTCNFIIAIMICCGAKCRERWSFRWP